MKNLSISRLVTAVAVAISLSFGLLSTEAAPLSTEQLQNVKKSPCGHSIAYLVDQYEKNLDVAKSFELIAANLVDPPESYHRANPWRVTGGGDELLNKMVDYGTVA